jgi:DNA-binding MarR family transcriptional regulator
MAQVIPAWLDDEEMAAWLALIGVVMRLENALDRQLRRDAGLTHFEYAVLVALSAEPERGLRMSALAAFTDAQLPRLSQVAARMEQRGLLTRHPDPADGRITVATLTKAGRTLVTASAPGHAAEVRRLVFDHLSRAQVRQLREIGNRISSALEH